MKEAREASVERDWGGGWAVLVEGLVSGHPDMPEFTFEPEQAEAIVGYLKGLE